jgi:hypothetical protein
MRWIILKEDGTTVHNVIVADEDFIAEHYPSAIKITDDVVVSPRDHFVDNKVLRVEPGNNVNTDFIDAEVVEPTNAIE